MKNFRSIQDVDALSELLHKAAKIKQQPLANQQFGKGRTLGLLFLNPSLRTRISTEMAAKNLGMHTIVLNIDKDGWKLELEDGVVMNQGSQEHIREAAGVLSQYCDIIGIRCFPSLTNRGSDDRETFLNKFIEHSTVPVISLESATRHPLQAFADILTIQEHKKTDNPKVVLTWAPHCRALPQSVANSFVEWTRRSEMDLVIANPEGFDLSPEITRGIPVVYDQDAALAGADFVYAKNWSSYSDYGKVGQGLDHWQITASKMAITNNGKFMHCLPVRRNLVVSDEVLDSEVSLVLAQAKNRTFTAQVVLQKLLQDV